MKKMPFVSSSDLMTLVFVLLYGLGVYVNLKNNNVIMACVWGALIVINLVFFAMRHLKKDDK
ncbi:hypothetical protein SAMN02910293_01488 [Streptococcus henryi]|jgi:hypothetical protein|uniref:Uncharacterized protein n=1 Tax=Streptococcus henryi TaxID=439219 RepID=A0A1G6CA08_9STRE|nr:hypothetical protein [Streptococcus henryi]SDB29621.1 hypothetical protein SAMN02910293_01488 [Streptococcus henryi]